MRYNLVIDGGVTERVEVFDNPPPAGPDSTTTWLEWVDRTTPDYDPATHRTGDIERAVVDGKAVWSRPVIALTNGERRQRIITDLAATDLSAIRAVDDLFEHIVNGTPIPDEVANRMGARQTLRAELRALDGPGETHEPEAHEFEDDEAGEGEAEPDDDDRPEQAP